MIKAGMVGLGRWGQTMLGEVQGKSKRIRFVHGVSKDLEVGPKICEKHGLRFSTELSDVLADPEVEAVFLITPHSLHLPQVQAVAKAGKPVWCEKPLSLTREAALAAIEACRKANVPLGTGTNKRCFASMRELEKLVRSGALGEVMHIEGHFSNEHSTRVSGGWRDDPNESPAYGMTGAGLHILDAFVNLVGPIRSVHASACTRKEPPDPRDVVAVLAEFENGATGTMATVRAAPMFYRVHVFGTKGSAEARGEDMLIVAPIGKPPETLTYPHVDPLMTLVEAFADTVANGTPFPIRPEQILDMVGAFEAVCRSVESGRPELVVEPTRARAIA